MKSNISEQLARIAITAAAAACRLRRCKGGARRQIPKIGACTGFWGGFLGKILAILPCIIVILPCIIVIFPCKLVSLQCKTTISNLHNSYYSVHNC